MADPKYGSAEKIMALGAPELTALLKDSAASSYAKAKACQRLAVVGDARAVPALVPLLSDAQLSTYARGALEQIPGAAADDALREAAMRLTGAQRVGVVHSIGKRRDRKAIEMLVKLRSGDDREAANAADLALSRIRPVL
jgi:HEAT repeat protein